MNLSVIINTFQRPQALAACLAALARQPEAEVLEVLVVDDGGAMDLAPVIVQARGLPGLRLERIPHAGPSGARNHGLRAARARRVLILGDDVLLQPGCLARHLLQADPAVAVVGPYPWSGLQGSPPFRRWADPVPQVQVANPANAGFKYFCTGNISVDRAALLDLGGFDERFRHGYAWEDIDLGLRFERAGGCIVFDPLARAIHQHSFSDRRALWRREYRLGINSLIFWEKWAPVDCAAVKFMKFWQDGPPGPGSPLRRALGDALVALTDRLVPASALNAWLYERMVFAHRLAGVAMGYRLAHGQDPAAEATRR